MEKCRREFPSTTRFLKSGTIYYLIRALQKKKKGKKKRDTKMERDGKENRRINR